MKFVQRKSEPARVDDARFYLILLALLAAAVAAMVTTLALVLHRNFLTIACDTAAVQSALVNTLHGNWFRDTAYDGPNLLGTHTVFALLLVLPLYAIFPSVDALFTLQIWGVYSTVIPVYLVAQEVLRRPPLAFCVGGAVLVSPLMLSMAFAPFHLETWTVASTFWAYFFYRRNNLVGFCVSAIFAMSCGEQAALLFLSLGVSMLLVNDGLAWRDRFGVISVAGALAWILLAVFVVEPFARPSSHAFNIFAYNYSQWQIKSAAGLPAALVHEPAKAISLLIDRERWQLVAVTVGLPLFCALFSWRSLLMLAPFPVYFLMNEKEFFLYFHAYYFSFAFVAGFMGLLFCVARAEASERFGIALVAATLFANVVLLCPTSAFYIHLAQCRDDAFSGTLRQAFAEIPVTAGVYAPHRYSAYLSNRPNMVMGDVQDEHFEFDIVMDERYQDTNVRAAQIDYIVVDCFNDQCGCRTGDYDADRSQRRTNSINNLIQSGEWRVIFNEKSAVILQRVK